MPMYTLIAQSLYPDYHDSRHSSILNSTCIPTVAGPYRDLGYTAIAQISLHPILASKIVDHVQNIELTWVDKLIKEDLKFNDE
jgi:hypothetical protein